MKLKLFLLAFTFTTLSIAQVGVNTETPDPSAILDVVSSDKGILLPRVELTALNDATPIIAPVNSLTVFNIATTGTVPNNVTPGYYFWDTDKWVRVGDGNDDADQEPWFGTDDDLGATSNTEDMYHLGRIGIGTDRPNNSLEIHGTDATGGDADVDVFSYGSEVTIFHTYRAGGSRLAPTAMSNITNNKYSLFSLEGIGYDGARYIQAGRIRFGISRTAVGPGNMPGFIEFSTTPLGSTIPLARMYITDNGNVGIGVPNERAITNRLHVKADTVDPLRLEGVREFTATTTPLKTANEVAKAAGLTVGTLYRTGEVLKIVF